MPRFFTDDIQGDRAIVSGEDARHIAGALRMRPGEELTLCDGAGWDYRCRVLSADARRVELAVEERFPTKTEPAVDVTLYQALPKSDKMELIIQKAVELGVGRIVPVMTRRCVSRPDRASFEKKRQRWQRVSLEAAKQSGRGRIPPVGELMDFSQALREMAEAPLALLFYENSREPLRKVLEQPLSRICLMVGAEGGFEPWEVKEALELGVRVPSLGRRILRCETAPLAALSASCYAAGEM